MPTSLRSEFDRISYINEITLEAGVDYKHNKESDTFEALILSGKNEKNNDGTLSHIFVRIKPDWMTEMSDPYAAKDLRSMYLKLNAFPQAYIAKKELPSNDFIPSHGQKWLCAYVTKKGGPYRLLRQLRTGQKILADVPLLANNPNTRGKFEGAPLGGFAAGTVGDYGVPPPSYGSIPYKPSGSKLTPEALYADLMAGIGNKNLVIAMVANAIAESALFPNNNGDCKDYARNRGIDTSRYPTVFRHPERGRCCSFGLWQYNICAGLGISLLQAYGAERDSPDEQKYRIITDYRKQVDFMIGHVKKKFNVADNRTIDDWVKLFVYRVERPADMAGATTHRQEIARGLNLG